MVIIYIDLFFAMPYYYRGKGVNENNTIMNTSYSI